MNIHSVKKYVLNPYRIFYFLGSKGKLKFIPDEEYLKLLFRGRIGKELNLDNPQTFNEKLQWLKLYDRNPNYPKLVDKYEVRKYVSNTIGEKYLIPLIGCWDRFEDIDFHKLPSQFVLKCTHDSGGLVICKEKRNLDIRGTKKIINKSLKKNYYYPGREWPYKNIEPKIICEKYVVDESGVDLKDYKFMCFSGVPKLIQVMSGRRKGHYYLNHFDLKWNRIEIPRKSISENPNKLEKPENLEEMISICKELSKDIPFARIDLYNTQKQILFGEITFFPVSGFMNFKDENHNNLLGSWIELPELNS